MDAETCFTFAMPVSSMAWSNSCHPTDAVHVHAGDAIVPEHAADVQAFALVRVEGRRKARIDGGGRVAAAEQAEDGTLRHWQQGRFDPVGRSAKPADG